MALSKLSVKSLGAVACLGLASVATFAVIMPLHDSTKENSSQLETARTTTISKELKLTQLQAGAVNFEQAKKDVEAFLKMTSDSQDVETASRSVSKAASKSGITLDSFNFGEPEAIVPLANPEANLSGYTSPVVIGGATATNGSTSETTGGATPSGAFQRVPIEVTITASTYLDLADYLDKLSEQDRLLNVVAVNSNKGSTDGDVKATISAYAFVYAK